MNQDWSRIGLRKVDLAMSPTILPEIVRCNLDPIRHALDASGDRTLSPEQADELFFLCSFLADAIEKSWATIQRSSREGIEGRKFAAVLHDVSGQIDECLQTYERLQKSAGGISAYPEAERNLSRLKADIERVVQVRNQVASLLDWLKATPPPVDLEHLKTLESGPFIRSTDLQARRHARNS
jgi:hypothetical protein